MLKAFPLTLKILRKKDHTKQNAQLLIYDSFFYFLPSALSLKNTVQLQFAK